MKTIRQAAWRDLIDRTWDRFPVRYAGAVVEPLVTSGEVMEALRGVDSPLGPRLLDEPPPTAAGAGECRVRVYRDGGELQDRAAFPAFRAADSATIEEYGAAVSARLGGRRFGVVVNEFQRLSAPLWQRLHDLLAALAAEVGFSAAKSEAVLFIGDYAATPFGVHRDSAAVLQFSITGRKTMLFWGPDELPAGHHSMPLDELAKSAVVLECGVDDVLAWPPEYHHTAHKEDTGLAATLSIAVYLEFEPAKLILESLQSVLNAAIGSGRRPRRLYRPSIERDCFAAGALPEELETAWQYLDTLVQSGAAKAWLRSELKRRYASAGLDPLQLPARELVKPLELTAHVDDGNADLLGPFRVRIPHERAAYVGGYTRAAPGTPITLIVQCSGERVEVSGTSARVDKMATLIELDANAGTLERLARASSAMMQSSSLREPFPVIWDDGGGPRRATAIDAGPAGMFILDSSAPAPGRTIDVTVANAMTTASVVYRDDDGFAVLHNAARNSSTRGA